MPTRNDLFSYGMSIGLTKDQVVSLLRKGGFDGLFDEKLYDEYVNYLSGWVKRRDELVEKYIPKDFSGSESIAEKATRVLRKVGERIWYFSPIAHNKATGEYRACQDGLKDGEELIYGGVTVKEFIDAGG